MEAGTCSCEVVSTPFDVYNETRPVARKDHRCDECRETLPAGKVYVKIDAFWDGHWEHLKRCEACHSIARDYCCGVVGRGAVRDMVWEYLGVDIVTRETKEVDR